MNELVRIILFIIPLALAPCVGIVFLIYFKDKYEKEPFHLLWKTFLLGMLAVVPAILIEVGFNYIGIDENQNLVTTLIYCFIVIAFTEEMSKFAVLRWYAFPKKDFNEPFDGIVYSVMVSMGFAAIENIFYGIASGIGASFLRMFTAVPMHAACAVMMGFFAGMAKFSSNQAAQLIVGLLVATTIHGLYDFFLFQYSVSWLAVFSIVVLAISVRISFMAIRLQQKNSPFNPENKD